MSNDALDASRTAGVDVDRTFVSALPIPSGICNSASSPHSL
jgi:hypothetical protein